MDLSQLQRIDEDRWTVPLASGETRVPVLLFGAADLLKSMDDKVIEQITNVARLPGLVGAAMTMPDGHPGYGFPIGDVAGFAAERGGVVSAAGVGFDISCGDLCLRSNLNLEDVRPGVAALADALFQTIPAGVGKEGEIHLIPDQLDEILVAGAEWAVRQGYGVTEDLEFVEEHGRVAGAVPRQVSELAKQRQLGEMGTLGSGNHYLEVQVVDRVIDETVAAAFGLRPNQILVLIHWGSRGLGHQVGTDYFDDFTKAASRLGIDFPDRELACATIASPEGQRYIGAMNAASNCALANRQVLAGLTRAAFTEVFPGAAFETLFDVSHNTCKFERYTVDGQERSLHVHRKGATRAFGPGHPAIPGRYRAVGQPVIIGGSMGTGSYILAGTSEGDARSLASASHGAGRAMSRYEALKHWHWRELIDDLAHQGILIHTRSLKGAPRRHRVPTKMSTRWPRRRSARVWHGGWRLCCRWSVSRGDFGNRAATI